MFIKYQHVERLSTDEVEGINIGECHVQPKIDGTSGSVWLEDNELKCASRRRELTDGLDNAGFKEYIMKQDNINCFFAKYPDVRLYGEFLKSHSLKTYRDDAWGKFYVFDVCKIVDEELVYIPYEEYKEMLDEFDLDYIPVLRTLVNAVEEDFAKILDQNTFLIKEGEGIGEGIVIKNYSFKNKFGRISFKNKFGRITWAKIVTSEFKEKHIKEFRGPKTEFKMIEQDIVDRFLTEAFIDKEFEKLKTEKGWSSKHIPELLSRIFHEFVVEHIWEIIKKMKNPKINFRTLNALVIMKVKKHKKDLF
jgi:hypothetical protein